MSFLFLIKERSFNPVLIYNLILIYIKKILKVYFYDENYSTEKIDIIIPTISKDYELLEHVIKSTSHIKQSVNKIFIISSNNQQIIDFCKKHNINFVDEKDVLGYGKDVIDYKVNGADRSGWIFQQLLKLSADKISTTENFLILDSDTVFIRDISFIDKFGKFCLQQSYEWHKKYFDTYRKLLKDKNLNNFSCISHMMIFNKEILKDLKNVIEKNNNKTWDKAILDLIDQNDGSYFSEYETYGNFIRKNYNERIYFKPFYNIGLSRKNLHHISSGKYSKNNTSLSFHEYIK